MWKDKTCYLKFSVMLRTVRELENLKNVSKSTVIKKKL